MTIHLTPLPHEGPTVSPVSAQRNAVPANAASHIFVGSAIAIVGLAVAMFAGFQLALPPLVAVIVGLAFAIGAGFLHVRLARPAAPRALAPKPSRQPARRTPTLDTPRQATPSLDAAPLPPVETSPATVEPSDLALALLASLNASAESKAASEPEPQPEPGEWTWALAAQLKPQSAVVSSNTEPVHIPGPPPVSAARVHADEAETEFQRVERLVKRLADNVNQLQAMRQAQSAGHQDGEQLTMFDEPGDPNLQLEASINALRRANAAHPIVEAAPAENATPPAPAAVPDMAWPKPAPVIARDPHMDSQRSNILSALNAQRIDVYLEPILDLADQRPQHYEVSIALRTFGGHAIDLTHAANDLSGTGLLPLIDQARIAHAANVARRLADRGKNGAVFAELNGETLDDGGFQETFANDTISVGAFPGQLVLTLPQAHVATFTTADWHTLARLREAGFGFALSDVTNLDMDFPRLRDAGFVFARLDAETFLIGLPTSDGVVPPADICRHLATSGLMLIVGGILEDHQLARIFGFGVLFGQGRLFGGPRPMKQEQGVAPQYAYAAQLAAPAE
ncbi:MAG: EAL domain-containing protein [Hyphomicrobiaceae bacterium]